MSDLRVLVVIPTRGDRAEWRAEEKASAEKQTHKADEIVVVGCAEQKDVLCSVPLNKAIEASQCDVFVLLSDDDLLLPSYIEKTVALMNKTRADIVWTDLLEFGGRRWADANGYCRRVSAPVTALTKKSAWKKVGGYQEVPFLDWDFNWAMRDKGLKDVGLHEPLFLYRVHSGQDRKANEGNQTAIQFIRSRHHSKFP